MAAIPGSIGTTENWWVRNAPGLKTAFRVIFGLVWLIDGSLKFAPGFVDQFAGKITPDGQPAWLHGWFTFWARTVATNTAVWVYLIGALELALGLALILGFLRKIAYIGGIVLSLFIWAVPEGFGGPYGPSSTDIGTGAIYAIAFLALIVINATYGTSRRSIDYWIERRWPAWRVMAEFGRPAVPAA